MNKQMLQYLCILALTFVVGIVEASAASDPWGYAGKTKGVTKDGKTTWTLKMTLKVDALGYKLRGALIGKNKKAKHVYKITGFFDPSSKIIAGNAKKTYSIIKGVKKTYKKKKIVSFSGGVLAGDFLVQFKRKSGNLLNILAGYNGGSDDPTPAPNATSTPAPQPADFEITTVIFASYAVLNGQKGDIKVRWVGSPVDFPVTLTHYPVSCPYLSKNCFKTETVFTTPTASGSLLVAENVVGCQGDMKDSVIMDFLAKLTDAKGRTTPSANAKYTCVKQ
ncbi:hypothetical protein OAO01_08400 [Oligoflexia bacterium]|nr:hypothetical protein [Oligoflexia bacterium]